MCIVPTMTYRCPTWALNKKTENKFRITQNKIEKSMLGIKNINHVPVQTIKNKLKNNIDINKYIM